MDDILDLYTTTSLQALVPAIKRPTTAIQQIFFPNVILSDKEKVAVDIERNHEKIAPIVHPRVAGKIVAERGYDTFEYKPAYVKMKTPLIPERALKRKAGETLGSGSMTPFQRQLARITGTAKMHYDMLVRRLEVMGAEAMMTGKLHIVGDGIDDELDFQRDAALTIQLAGAAKWDQANADPIANLEEWGDIPYDLEGVTADVVVMDRVAWKLFAQNAKVLKILEVRRAAGAGPLFLGPANTQAAADYQGLRGTKFMGRFGDYDIYVYNASYKLNNGDRARILPPGTVLFGASGDEGVNGARSFGMIADDEAALEPQEFFLKSWLEKDPAMRVVMSQSAPVMVPTRVNAAGCATVI
jgi:hypothetical protein